jgi:RNA polymerase sigma-70 factor (ECF subfamily)
VPREKPNDRTHSASQQPDRQADEPVSVVELYDKHGADVVRWAGRLGGPETDLEDIVQEVFMIAHRQLSGFRGESKASSWLFAITQNVVRHRRRKDFARRRFLGKWVQEPEAVRQGPTPMETVIEQEATRRVYAALEGMSERHRTVLVLFELEGLSGAEIAELTGLKPSTLRVTLLRARAAFEKALRALEGGTMGGSQREGDA